MKRQSRKALDADRRARRLVEAVYRCELCGHDPRRAKKGWVSWRLVCHEISRGSFRQQTRGKKCACLVLCWHCHERIHAEGWNMARQLALLKRSRPKDYNRKKFLQLICRAETAITKAEVERWLTSE